MKKSTSLKKFMLLTLTGMVIFTNGLFAQEGYVAGDFHQHSTYTDGSYTIGHVMQKSADFGLDWWANSEHGGAFNRWATVSGLDLGTEITWDETGIPLLGDATGGNMFRWQSLRDWSFRDVMLWRRVLSDKLIIQGYEMNVPGHEHGSVAIIASQFSSDPNVNPLAEFEYKFDNSDKDVSGGAALGWVKSAKSGHAKTLEAIQWLQANYAGESWLVPAHPERKKLYNISYFRDMNNAGPDVCFGFESMPGHQKDANRGGYTTSADGGGTYGGCGVYAAEVGGLWDALLSEGRNFWLFVSSDFHDLGGDFYPGEYQKTYTFVNDKKDPKEIVAGLRSGNSFVVEGDLIDNLTFKLRTTTDAFMGQTLECKDGYALAEIVIRDPQTNNNFGMNPILDHVDVIMGDITGIVDPANTNYNTPKAPGTRIIARFDEIGGVTSPNGITSKQWMRISDEEILIWFAIRVVDGCYIRLRGTNQGLNVEKETDVNGNPILDFELGVNDSIKAISDLWFYSNPIFAAPSEKTSSNGLKSGLLEDYTKSDILEDNNQVYIYPNPAKDVIYVSNAEPNSTIEIYNMSGKMIISKMIEGNSVSISELSKGLYMAVVRNSQKVNSTKFVVE